VFLLVSLYYYVYSEADGELVATNPQYATQRSVFNDLGQDVLTNAFEGYNSTLFAYGKQFFCCLNKISLLY
jgi:hypothetical protein